MPEAYSRPASGLRFPTGIKVSAQPDAIPADRSPYLQNVRHYLDSALVSRPQLAIVTPAPASSPGPVLSLEPTLGVYKEGGGLFYSGALIDSGYTFGQGCSLTPFRPNASPAPWEYVWDAAKPTKVLPGSPVTVWPTGMPEPSDPLLAQIYRSNTNYNIIPSGSWANGGTAGTVSTAGIRLTDTVGGAFIDPLLDPTFECTLQVGSASQYQKGMLIEIAGTQTVVVHDVFAPVAGPLTITAIYYYGGTGVNITGRCIVVPQLAGPPAPAGGSSASQTEQLQDLLGGLRRGALVQIGSEVCRVDSVTTGPTGTICFETYTSIHHTAAESLNGVPAIQIVTGTVPSTGQSLSSTVITYAVTTGVGTVSTFFTNNLFTVNGQSFHPDDYIHFSLNIDNLANLSDGKIIFDVNNGTADYETNAYYYSFTVSDIQQALGNTLSQQGLAQLLLQQDLIDEEASAAGIATPAQTVTGNSQWSEISFPINSLTRIGNDQTRSLANCQGVQVLLNATGTINVAFGSLTVGNGYAVDVGTSIEPIRYRFRPRDSRTGAKGNPSPEMRYGVWPRRQTVLIQLPSGWGPPSQADTWDIFRMGGAVESYRYVGSQAIGQSQFEDNYTDAEVLAGDAIDTDCYEPFPSIDNAQTMTSVNVTGTVAVITGAGANIARYLPGTLIQIGTQNVYTLWARPTSLGSGQWLLQLVENAGYLIHGYDVSIAEPALAAQPLAFAWGPDPQGRIYAVGDNLRPGGVYWTNPQNPDGASDQNFKELCAPSEPLQNGCLLAGVSVVFSPRRAWAGYPQSDGTISWQEIPVGNGLAAPFGLCCDGSTIYAVTRNGIQAGGLGPAQSLTDADLYTLFPHDGVLGTNSIYTGKTVYAPDFSRSVEFRLSTANGYLFFDYPDTVGASHSLVCDLRDRSWTIDIAADSLSVIHATTTSPSAAGTILYVGGQDGAIRVEQNTPVAGTGEQVACVVCTREETAGDLRAPKQWGDIATDTLAAGSSLTVTPMLTGQPFGSPTTIPGGQSARQVYVVPLAGSQDSLSLGLALAWIDQGVRSLLTMWQPDYVVLPELILNRQSVPTSHGATGIVCLGQDLIVGYVANAPVTLTITADDFLVNVVLPGTGGRHVRGSFPVPPIKGYLLQYSGVSSAPWQLWPEESFVNVREWGSSAAFRREGMKI